jgi:hypothetical protein
MNADLTEEFLSLMTMAECKDFIRMVSTNV